MNMPVKETQAERLRTMLKGHPEPTARTARLLAVRFNLYALHGTDCDAIAAEYAQAETPAPKAPAKQVAKRTSKRKQSRSKTSPKTEGKADNAEEDSEG